MIVLNVERLLKEEGKSKEWLCNEMDISHFNLNKAIKSGKKSITYKYLEGFCKALDCTFDELMTIVPDNDKERG